MISIRVPITTYETFELGLDAFEKYIVDARYFCPDHQTPEFIQLFRKTEVNGHITECAILPLEIVGEDLPEYIDEWFKENCEKVYNYLSEQNKELY